MSTVMSQPQQSPDRPKPYRTPLSVRRALLVIGGIVAVLMVAQTTVSLLDLASRHTTTDVRTFEGVTALVIDDSSDVSLTSAPAGSPLEVHARVTEGLRSPERRVTQNDDGQLRLSSSCPIFFGGTCTVDYEIRVPAGTAIRAETSAGDIEAIGLRSAQPVELDTSAGDITVADVEAPTLDLSSSAGDVSASGVNVPDVHADTAAGDVDLSLIRPAERVEANTSAGDVVIVVPDALYRVRTESSAGDVDTEAVRTSPDASRTIRAVTSAGDILIGTRR